MSHVTRTPLLWSKGQRSRSPGRFSWLYWQANMDIELVTDPDACMMYIVTLTSVYDACMMYTLTLTRAGQGHIVAASRLQLVNA